MNEQIEIAIIGGGHAGLTMSDDAVSKKVECPFSFSQWIGWQLPRMSLR